MIAIKDLVGLRKPLTRLIEVIAQGTGAVFKASLIKRNADAEAYKIGVIASALAEAGANLGVPVVYNDGAIEAWKKPQDGSLVLEPVSVEERTVARLEYQDRRHQENLENITSVAASDLAEDSEVPNERPDDDWIARFFSHAQDISSGEMQDLWGRILSGEIRQPGTFSLRALDAVRNISKHEAQLLEHVGKFALRALDAGVSTHIIDAHDEGWLKAQRIHPGNIFHLSELGLMFPTMLALTTFKDVDCLAFESAEHIVVVDRGELLGEVALPVWKFTGVGSELLELIESPLNEECLTQLGKFFANRKAKVRLGRITTRDGAQIHFDNELVIAPDAPS